MKELLFTCAVMFIATTVFAQSNEIYLPVNFTKALQKETRSMSGKPGKNYWQNFGEYNIYVKFNPKTLKVEGTEVITYYNNSPDTLKKMVFRLAPNFYKKGVKRNMEISPEDENEGVSITKFLINSEEINVSNPKQVIQNGTIIETKIKPVLPQGGRATVEINWSYTLNKGSHIRTGKIDDGSYFLAYFFPRITVYDDTEGWDEFEYLGRQETYFDENNFNVFITVPKNYMVWGTGNLENPAEVLHESVLKKWTKATMSDQPVFVIDSSDIKHKTVTLNKKWNTFHFKTSAPDFVFALSDHYLWQARNMVVDSSTYRKTFVTTAFNPIHKDFFEVNNFTAQTIAVMSFDFPGVPYPYQHITVVDGLDQMEYPMMVNDNPTATRFDGITLTSHEVFHQLFPFWMGTNQTKYAWMDEGWATLGEWYISPLIDSTIKDDYGMYDINHNSGKDWDAPIITTTTELGRSMFMNNYPKPALTYLYLWDMLGDKVFKEALRFYMWQWTGKHPTPWDFFNCINTATGKNLNWFWNAWYYQPGYPDLAIIGAEKKKNGYLVSVEMRGNKPVPLNLTAHFSNSQEKKFHQSIAVWENATIVDVWVPSTEPVLKFTLGGLYDGDIDRTNNTFVPRD
jgi:hypothetical protein